MSCCHSVGLMRGQGCVQDPTVHRVASHRERSSAKCPWDRDADPRPRPSQPLITFLAHLIEASVSLAPRQSFA